MAFLKNVSVSKCGTSDVLIYYFDRIPAVLHVADVCLCHPMYVASLLKVYPGVVELILVSVVEL